jgi:PAS domain S-box-containing protein
VRNRRQVTIAQFTPAAEKAAPEFHEVDRAVVLVLPTARNYLGLVLIDLDDGTGPDDRKHSVVRHAHESVNSISQVQVLDQADGNFSPDFGESRQEAGPVEMQSLARTQRNSHRFFFDFVQTGCQLRLRWPKHGLIPVKITQVAAEKAEHVRPVNAIDRPQEIFWMMDANTQKITYVNYAYTTITGYSVESLQRNPFSYQELIHPEDRIRVLSRLHDLARFGTLDEEFRFIRADGEVRWVWAKGFPVRADGATRWLVGATQDITSRKQAEMKISEQLDLVDAARAEAEALRKATLALSRNLAMDAVLDTLLECIFELIPFGRATVLFVEDDAQLMVAREAPRITSKRIGITLSASGNIFLQRILFEKQAVLLTDIAKQSYWRDIQPLERFQSWLGVPLIAGGHVLGILSLGASTPSFFTSEHLRLAKSLAIPAAVAIQNARIHERAEIYAAELELRLEELRNTQKALQDVSRELSDPASPC